MNRTQLLLGAAVAVGAFLGVVAAAMLIKQQVAAGVAESPVGTLSTALGNILP